MGEINKTKFKKIDDGIVIHDVCCSKYPLKNYKINFKEQAILKEFEELGYEYRKNQDGHQFINYEKELGIVIISEIKGYSKCDTDVRLPLYVTSKEHQLLHRLFEIWGWI